MGVGKVLLEGDHSGSNGTEMQMALSLPFTYQTDPKRLESSSCSQSLLCSLPSLSSWGRVWSLAGFCEITSIIL